MTIPNKDLNYEEDERFNSEKQVKRIRKQLKKFKNDGNLHPKDYKFIIDCIEDYIKLYSLDKK